MPSKHGACSNGFLRHPKVFQLPNKYLEYRTNIDFFSKFRDFLYYKDDSVPIMQFKNGFSLITALSLVKKLELIFPPFF